MILPALGARARRSSILAALSLAGSVFLSATANGIAVFMVFGAGLVAGPARPDRRGARLGHAADVADVASWLLPFEALYQAALAGLTADTVGFTRLAIDLGPVRRRASPPAPGCGCGRSSTSGLVGRGPCEASPRRDL